MIKAISLIGIMGSGKTSIAKKLAKKLNIESIDTDAKIKELTSFSVSELIKMNKIDLLNEIELKIIKEYANKKYIISTGDNTVNNIKAWNFLMNNTTTIWINLALIQIFNRLKPTENRPILNEDTFSLQDFQTLYKKRKRFYQKSKFELRNLKKENIEKLLKALDILLQSKIIIS